MNLAKGRVGEDNSALLGAMMITKIQLAAMSRVNIPENERKDFYLYVDEFQNFATESFAGILSEARKYRLNLILAHQYIEQVDEMVTAAVFGNVGTIVTFRVGATDAEFLEKEFFPTFTQYDLVNLTKYETYLKLMIDGVASQGFSAITLPPIDIGYVNPEIKDKVIAVSRERYASPRHEIEERITRWSENKHEEAATEEKPAKKIYPVTAQSSNSEKKPVNKKTRIKKPLAEVDCSFCGTHTEINFIPDPNKPVYCKKCLELSKQGKIPSPSSIKKVSQSEEKKEDNKEEFISLAEALKVKPEFKKDVPKQEEKKDDKNILGPGEVVKF
jgi:CxxC-x17-CxxC domain-containing protein